MSILKVNGSIVRVGGKLVKSPESQTWYPLVMKRRPEGERFGNENLFNNYASATTNPNLSTDWSAFYQSNFTLTPLDRPEYPVTTIVTNTEGYADAVTYLYEGQTRVALPPSAGLFLIEGLV